MTAPLVIPIAPPPAVVDTLERFSHWPQPILFHSALVRPPLGRYSYLSADPVRSVVIRDDDRRRGVEAFSEFRQLFAASRCPPCPEIPPFQGGVAGLVCYEAGGLFENLPRPRFAGDSGEPVAMAGLYDWALAWDHLEGRAWIVVQSHLARDSQARLAQIQAALQVSPALSPTSVPVTSVPVTSAPATGIPAASPRFPCHRLPGLESNFDRDSYLEAVRRVVRYIRAGDIFQANLSQRLTIPAATPPVALYRRLCEANPAPFSGYFDAGPFQVLSTSPERFLRLDQGVVQTRPIKGTRARRTIPEADLFTRDELRESRKDQAENVMIVDLLRNDLSRVCRPGTIRVTQLCEVETYQTVQHLVSEVIGSLAPGRDFFDLLAAAFPGGSITGAPKIRAMQIIAELEQVPRGPYCGMMFYLGCDGTADSSILIRTLTQQDGWLRFPVGGGITAQSNPADEYEETLHKAEGLLRALDGLQADGANPLSITA